MLIMRKKKLTKKDIKRSDGVQVKSVIHRMKMREVELTIISVTSIIVVIISTFYLISSSVQKHENYNKLDVGDIEVVFHENKDNIDDIIRLDYKDILSDEENLNSKSYVLKIQNHSKHQVSYVLKIVDDNDMIEADACRNKLLDRKYIKYSINKSIPKILGTEEVILHNVLKKSGKTSYEIRIWVDNSYMGDVNFHYHGKIIVEEK